MNRASGIAGADGAAGGADGRCDVHGRRRILEGGSAREIADYATDVRAGRAAGAGRAGHGPSHCDAANQRAAFGDADKHTGAITGRRQAAAASHIGVEQREVLNFRGLSVTKHANAISDIGQVDVQVCNRVSGAVEHAAEARARLQADWRKTGAGIPARCGRRVYVVGELIGGGEISH